ncbi:MAG: (d)CMP kinase, partial [Thermoleophilia bacterium]|nr:(d)CMP kinase [Thermoleophilia bacterium]
MIITIDGPAGSGKSTIAREVAKRLGMRYLDTGAMYRAITLLALEAGLVPERIPEAAALARQASLHLEERPNDLVRVFLDGREVTNEIRSPLVSQNVSAVSADPGVREVLTARQRAEAAQGNVVLEGRDMGTVVCPAADLKVFLTASVTERARRRQRQLEAVGVSQSLTTLEAEIAARDAYDSNRTVAPLRPAPDAVHIDTTDLTIEEVVRLVCAEAQKRSATPPKHPCPEAGGLEPTTDVAGGSNPPDEQTEMRSGDKPRKWPLSRLIRGPLDTLLYRIAYSFIPPVWRRLFRMTIEGQEHLPLSGPVVLAANHRSNLDPFFLGVSTPRQIHFMAKAELWKFRPLGWVIDAMGAFPIKRGEADREAVKRALSVLEAGAVLGIFPEGHRQRQGGLGEIHPGIALFSLRPGVVTVPVVLAGTE